MKADGRMSRAERERMFTHVFATMLECVLLLIASGLLLARGQIGIGLPLLSVAFAIAYFQWRIGETLREIEERSED